MSKSKAAIKRWNDSEKGHAAAKRYQQSEKGLATMRKRYRKLHGPDPWRYHKLLRHQQQIEYQEGAS